MNQETVLSALRSEEIVKALGRTPNVLNIYAYGSRVFGNASSSSDYDYIVVEEGEENREATLAIPSLNMDITLYDCKRFRDRIAEHEISILECLMLPAAYILQEKAKFDWSLDKSKLRESLSAKSSNSWVKAKKKFEVEHQPYIAKKSLWHSLRILKFGLQIATHGRIADFSECNALWKDIRDNPSLAWEDYKRSYQDTYNKLKTQFRLAAPQGNK